MDLTNRLTDTDTDPLELTAGEAAILTILETMQDQLNELTEKVNNLNQADSDGFSVERY